MGLCQMVQSTLNGLQLKYSRDAQACFLREKVLDNMRARKHPLVAGCNAVHVSRWDMGQTEPSKCIVVPVISGGSDETSF